MAFSLKCRSSLWLIGLTVLVTVHVSSGQFFGRNRLRTAASVNSNTNKKPCFLIYPNMCDDDSDFDTSSPDPPPIPWLPFPITSPQVELLSIAETCSANFITQDYEDNWEVNKGTTRDHDPNVWPIRLSSKLFAYLMAFNLYESNGLDITENQLEKSSCLVTNTINGWSITNTTGFGGKSVLLRLVRTNIPKVFRFTLPYGPLGASAGTASIILSDNYNYNVFEFCFDNGLRTFAMFTRKPRDIEMGAVKLHLKAIGFKEQNFLDLDPDYNCEGSLLSGKILTPKTGEDDLPSPRPISKALITFVEHNSIFPVAPLFWKKK